MPVHFLLIAAIALLFACGRVTSAHPSWIPVRYRRSGAPPGRSGRSAAEPGP